MIQLQYMQLSKTIFVMFRHHNCMPDDCLFRNLVKTLLFTLAVNNAGSLDFPVNEEELKIATKILKAGKGTGIDTLRNEMLRPLVELYPQLLSDPLMT